MLHFVLVNKLDVKWVEHLGVCRTFYKQYLVLKKKTAIDCKNTCASDGHCAMVRYYTGTNKCSLCNSVQLDPSDYCPFLSDFYIKGTQFINFSSLQSSTAYCS